VQNAVLIQNVLAKENDTIPHSKVCHILRNFLQNCIKKFILISFDGFFSKMFSHPFYRKPATCFATSGWHNFPASDFRRVAKENHPFLQLLELSGIPSFKFLIIRSANNHLPHFLV
jgi:hypothetical protein